MKFSQFIFWGKNQQEKNLEENVEKIPESDKKPRETEKNQKKH